MMKMMNECNCFVVETACWVCVCVREALLFSNEKTVFTSFISNVYTPGEMMCGPPDTYRHCA